MMEYLGLEGCNHEYALHYGGSQQDKMENARLKPPKRVKFSYVMRRPSARRMVDK